MDNQKPLGLYVHIPFCKAKCAYCDFISFAADDEMQKQYIHKLIEEISQKSKQCEGYVVRSIFFGGGTPSLLPVNLMDQLLYAVQENYELDKNAEITMEANPDTVSKTNLRAYRRMGVNRISFGVQAWQNRLLERIQRIHTIERAVESFYEARAAGFSRINIDLMFALPDQTMKDWQESLVKTAELQAEHISCYGLTLAEGTKLHEEWAAGRLLLADDETDRAMYYKAKEILSGYHYSQYEISNFSKPGEECRHNLCYWTLQDYLGLGLSAHSMMENRRFHNADTLDSYLSGSFEAYESQSIETLESMTEFMILGLRMTKGVSETTFFAKYHHRIVQVFGEEIKTLIEKKLLAVTGDGFCLTDYGMDIANYVFEHFVKY